MKMKLKAVAKYKDGGKSIKEKEDGDDKKYNDKLVGRTSKSTTDTKPTGDQTKKEEVQKAAGIKGDSRLKPGQKGYDEALKERTMKLNTYNKQNIDQRAAATSKAKSEQSASTTVKKAGLASENKDTQTTKTKAYVDKTKAREQAIKDDDKKKSVGFSFSTKDAGPNGKVKMSFGKGEATTTDKDGKKKVISKKVDIKKSGAKKMKLKMGSKNC